MANWEFYVPGAAGFLPFCVFQEHPLQRDLGMAFRRTWQKAGMNPPLQMSLGNSEGMSDLQLTAQPWEEAHD